MTATDALEAYNVCLLRCREEYLLLQRSPQKAFAPGRWTGVGGHVEPHEFHRLRAAALREVQEETGVPPQDIEDFVLRRLLLVCRPDQPVRVLTYYTGSLEYPVTPASAEGELAWKRLDEFDGLDIIETTRLVLPLLAMDMLRDPAGGELPKPAVAVFDSRGVFQRLLWGSQE